MRRLTVESPLDRTPRASKVTRQCRAPTSVPIVPFSPADRYNPLAGQVMQIRYGPVDEDYGVSAYTVQVRQDNGNPVNLRMTHPVMDALFGPPVAGSPQRQQWDAAREQRMRELRRPGQFLRRDA